ncbi:MAG: T9SS type A sorting domain-containing protein [Bacteroidales bacterium]|nr:T9SS type A sorting domain-containing protein [Bacteroidales bacterium]
MCKLKYLILITLFGKLLFPQQSFSQVPYLNKTFLINGNYNLINSIIPSDSGYIVAFSYGNTLCLLDSSANVKWERNYSFFNMTPFLTKILPIANNEYIITGTCQNGTAQNNLIFAIKLNSIFDTIYSKVLLRDSITCNGCLHSNTVIETTNNNLLFAGVHTKDSNDVSTGNRNGLFLLTDSSSNILRRVTIGPQNDDEGFASAIQMGNYYYLFGATRSYAPSYVIGFDRTDGWVVKTDLQGNEVVSAAFGHPELNDGEFNFVFSLPNFELATGFTKGRFYIINDDLSINRELIIGRNELVNDTNYALTFWDGYVKNNVITLLGRETRFNMSTYQYTSIVKVVKLDLNYKIINHKYYTHANYLVSNLIPQTITPTSDGGYIFGGYVVDNTLTPSQQAWLVKTDSLGCDGFMSCNDTALVVQILNYPDTLCKDSTYQIAVRLKGRSAPYSLYANSTLALDSIYYPYTLPLWIDTIMPFVPQDTGWQNLVVTLHEPWERTASDTAQVFVRNCTSSANPQYLYEQQVDIFPNPANSVLHVSLSFEKPQTYTVTIYDMQGKSHSTTTTSHNVTAIDISALPDGLYMVKVVSNRFGVYKKFVKMSEPLILY